MTHILLIDADSIYFKAAVVADKMNLSDSRKERAARMKVDQFMFKMEHKFPFAEKLVAIGGSDNFRKTLFPNYKANRPDKSDEFAHILQVSMQHMENRWEARRAHGMEADDLVSIWSSEAKEDGELIPIVAGIDKDLRQIPGEHYNYNKEIRDIVSEDEANRLLMLQCLTGDSIDNIPGILGMGPVKADKALGSTPKDQRWDRVKSIWKEKNPNGDPSLSRRLLEMIKSWEEFEEVQACVQKKTDGLIRGSSTFEFIANPLSINAAYFRKRGGDVVKTKAYNEFESAMEAAVTGLELESTELKYDIKYKFGFARVTSDVDNPIKPTTDVLQKFLGFNDRQVYRITAEKYVGSGAWVDVTIREFFPERS